MSGGVFPRPRENRLYDAVKIGVDVMVPKPQRAKTLRREKGVPARIVREPLILAVLGAVRFHDELVFEADEIENIAFERRLTAEMQALRAQSAQLRPKLHFPRRHGFAQCAGFGVGHGLSLLRKRPTRPRFAGPPSP
jgi:hypothetical protein